MKNILIGFIIAVALLAGSRAFATPTNTKWYLVDYLNFDYRTITKTYDEDAGVVCYSLYNNAISCLKIK